MTNKLGEYIRNARKERGLGLRVTASKVDISPGYLSRIESGSEKYAPAEKTLRKLSEVLEVSFDEMMAIAGKIAKDVTEHVKDDPQMPEFLRQVRDRNISAEELLEMLKKKRKKK